MPTGYTAAIADGITFKQFALRCARAMGPLITMREGPEDAPIPEALVPSDHHREWLGRSRASLDALLAVSESAKEGLAAFDYETAMDSFRARSQQVADLKGKYEEILRQVRAYQVPAGLVPFKKFMEEQILDSMDQDCCTIYNVEPVKRDSAAWFDDRVAKARADVAYHEKEWLAEVERTNSRNVWIKSLHESLADAQ